jgi:hypothetical protein
MMSRFYGRIQNKIALAPHISTITYRSRLIRQVVPGEVQDRTLRTIRIKTRNKNSKTSIQ